MAKARAALLDVEDELQAATAALSRLQEKLVAHESAADVAGQRVAAAADGVVRSRAEAVLAEAEEAVAVLRSKRVMLRFFRNPEVGGDLYLTNGHAPWPTLGFTNFHVHQARAEAFQQVDAEINNFMSAPVIDDENRWNKHPTVELWQRARVALMTDPDAPLP
jgi:hypothetical protein